MPRRLLALALLVGCAPVEAVSLDAAPDGTPPGPTIDLARGCVMRAKMDEPSWATGARPVLNMCGSDAGAITGSTATTVADATRGSRVGSFTGTACVEFVNNATLHGTTGLTMSAWIRPTGLNMSASHGIISKRNDRSVMSEYGLFVWTGDHVWIDLADTDRFVGTATLSNNTWYHLAAVFDSSRIPAERVRLFINGAPDALTRDVIGNLGTTLPSYTSPLRLGCVPSPSAMTQQTFQGQLDDVTIWSRALSDEELAALPMRQ